MLESQSNKVFAPEWDRKAAVNYPPFDVGTINPNLILHLKYPFIKAWLKVKFPYTGLVRKTPTKKHESFFGPLRFA